MKRYSVLDGRYAHEWVKYCPQLGTDLSVAQVASTVLVAPHATEAHHFCGCGRIQTYCAPCDQWVCGAPGHIQHDCRSTGASP